MVNISIKLQLPCHCDISWFAKYQMQLSKLLFMCLPLAVPSGAPTNVSVEVLSSNSIFITWQPPEPSQQNGVINGYTIRLTALQDGSNHVYNLSGTVLLQSHLIEGPHLYLLVACRLGIVMNCHLE